MEPIVNERRAESPEEVSLKELIKNHAQKIQTLTEQLKEKRELFNENLESNQVYKEADEKVKESTREKKNIKATISQEPSMRALDQEIKDLKFDLTESKKTLSDLSINYRDISKNTQLTLLSGVVVEITLGAKLVRK